MTTPLRCASLLLLAVAAAAGEALPQGWLPLATVDRAPTWPEIRKTIKGPTLFMPENVPVVRGVFACYVFHGADPRDVARAWRFAMVLVPTDYEYDLGWHDKRNPRGQSGIPKGHMGNLLTYLDHAATELKRPELAKAPIVGWLGQNGAVMAGDLFKRAPDRLVAWSDAWYHGWAKYPEMIAQVPVASAWEFKKGERDSMQAKSADAASPPTTMQLNATTYGFQHGIYSKFNFFMCFLDRAIRARVPATPPAAGQPVPLAKLDLSKGWAGDWAPVSTWNPMAPFAEAKGYGGPVWMVDAYTAWMWRSYHSNGNDIALTSPAREFSRGNKDSGLGYGPSLSAATPVTMAAETKGAYAAVEFRDGDVVLGTAKAAPYSISGVRLERGIRALFAVGIRADGTRAVSKPAIVAVLD